MTFELEDYHRNVPDSELIADLKRVAGELGKNSVTRADQDERGKFSSATVFRRFGNWFRALELAGLQKTRTPMNISEEELFLNLEEIWAKLGRQPRGREICKPLSKFDCGTYENRFGTWRNALEAFVAYVNDEERVPTEISDVSRLGAVVIAKGARTINWRLRFMVMRRDHFKCKTCGRSPATDPSIVLHVDHIIAWTRNGPTVLENLQTLCSVCNIGKSDLDLEVSEVTNVATI